jgi:hypothetical protein
LTSTGSGGRGAGVGVAGRGRVRWRGQRRRLGHERCGRLVAVEALESLGGVGEAGPPLAHAQADQQREGQQDQDPELRRRVEHGTTVPRPAGRRLE